jgi:hypothetical protein
MKLAPTYQPAALCHPSIGASERAHSHLPIAAEKRSSISSADSATLISITTINQLTGFFAEQRPSNRKGSIARAL